MLQAQVSSAGYVARASEQASQRTGAGSAAQLEVALSAIDQHGTQGAQSVDEKDVRTQSACALLHARPVCMWPVCSLQRPKSLSCQQRLVSRGCQGCWSHQVLLVSELSLGTAPCRQPRLTASSSCATTCCWTQIQMLLSSRRLSKSSKRRSSGRPRYVVLWTLLSAITPFIMHCCCRLMPSWQLSKPKKRSY